MSLPPRPLGASLPAAVADLTYEEPESSEPCHACEGGDCPECDGTGEVDYEEPPLPLAAHPRGVRRSPRRSGRPMREPRMPNR
jgi:hypothetical protein